MKFLIVAIFLIAVAAAANPRAQYGNDELGRPFDDYLAYMKCAPTQIDQFSAEYDCESIWDEYRQKFFDNTADFENCSNHRDNYEAEK